jgi:hypothetical protein
LMHSQPQLAHPIIKPSLRSNHFLLRNAFFYATICFCTSTDWFLSSDLPWVPSGCLPQSPDDLSIFVPGGSEFATRSNSLLNSSNRLRQVECGGLSNKHF